MKTNHDLSTVLGCIAIAWGIAVFGFKNATILEPIAAQLVWGMFLIGSFIIRAIEDLPHDHR